MKKSNVNQFENQLNFFIELFCMYRYGCCQPSNDTSDKRKQKRIKITLMSLIWSAGSTVHHSSRLLDLLHTEQPLPQPKENFLMELTDLNSSMALVEFRISSPSTPKCSIFSNKAFFFSKFYLVKNQCTIYCDTRAQVSNVEAKPMNEKTSRLKDIKFEKKFYSDWKREKKAQKKLKKLDQPYHR
jgi:hypothetical protein